MNTRRFLLALTAATGAVLAGFTSVSAGASDAPEPRLSANLIWGTNGSKPSNQDLRPIDPELEKRLRRIFKWQNYYGIERKEFSVAPNKTTQVEMSKECRLEIQRVGPDEYEIQLFGKGVPVVKQRKRIVPTETVVLGGDDKNDNAWFVVVGVAKPK